MSKLKCIMVLALSFATFGALAQEEEGQTRNWSVNGYLKNMQTLLFFNGSYPDLRQGKLVDTFLQDNLIHHRLNFRWAPAERWRFRADLRSRVFYGDLVRSLPDYGASVDDANNDYFDLSTVLYNGNAWVVHSMIDRFYAEYTHDKLEVRLGRQRINWGISTLWNPNDIFNAFAFTDFDYEERPGSDALRLRYYTGFASSVEFAVSMFDDWERATMAGLWKFNRWAYDFQVLGGYARGDWVLGGGWAGNLGGASWKTEFTGFLPQVQQRDPAFALSTELGYVFPSGLYGGAGYLYNSEGSAQARITGLFAFELSARNLYPYRHAAFLQASYPVTPLVNASLAAIYSPVSAQALFLNPALTYSITTDWDLDLVGQLAFDRGAEGFGSPLQAVFLRVKWSY